MYWFDIISWKISYFEHSPILSIIVFLIVSSVCIVQSVNGQKILQLSEEKIKINKLFLANDISNNYKKNLNTLLILILVAIVFTFGVLTYPVGLILSVPASIFNFIFFFCIYYFNEHYSFTHSLLKGIQAAITTLIGMGLFWPVYLVNLF